MIWYESSQPSVPSAFGLARLQNPPSQRTLPSPRSTLNFLSTPYSLLVFSFLLAVLHRPGRPQCSPVDIESILSPNADLTACIASREACLVRAARLRRRSNRLPPQVLSSALLHSTFVLIDDRFLSYFHNSLLIAYLTAS
ncbi:hypothetical protein K432DRAFT_72612 [Lepidopterella palustris CBS 459.81]|uniref:Uncharacterized protein n=1 Tax=Lepidopterella palustris CBS 459.81 TaxID=1314670 RepID=A0A8E2EJM9_9PEZI|nr:hypothetical protein K432DRAFT_72612 [Lepidopterella palustris CBS 459.81]